MGKPGKENSDEIGLDTVMAKLNQMEKQNEELITWIKAVLNQKWTDKIHWQQG